MLISARVEQAFLEACRLDVEAFKPGNVSLASPGHGMTAADFLKSAEVSAPIVAAPGLAVGERILTAVQATWNAVGCNTNLGIVLLCAPLAQAALRRADLNAVLAALDVEDARAVFEAIRLASPGGLGQAPEHDVRQTPTVTLLQAMQAAADRDRVAHQYASNFEDVQTLGVGQARAALAMGWPRPWAMTRVFMVFLSEFPDSHIARKYGWAVADQVRAEARSHAPILWKASDPAMAFLAEWDQSLKARRLNPGTSADLSVAAWFALALEDLVK